MRRCADIWPLGPAACSSYSGSITHCLGMHLTAALAAAPDAAPGRLPLQHLNAALARCLCRHRSLGRIPRGCFPTGWPSQPRAVTASSGPASEAAATSGSRPVGRKVRHIDDWAPRWRWPCSSSPVRRRRVQQNARPAGGEATGPRGPGSHGHLGGHWRTGGQSSWGASRSARSAAAAVDSRMQTRRHH